MIVIIFTFFYQRPFSHVVEIIFKKSPCWVIVNIHVSWELFHLKNKWYSDRQIVLNITVVFVYTGRTGVWICPNITAGARAADLTVRLIGANRISNVVILWKSYSKTPEKVKIRTPRYNITSRSKITQISRRFNNEV